MRFNKCNNSFLNLTLSALLILKLFYNYINIYNYKFQKNSSSLLHKMRVKKSICLWSIFHSIPTKEKDASSLIDRNSKLRPQCREKVGFPV